MKGIRFSLWRAAAVLVALVVLCGFVACKEPDSEDLIFENVSPLTSNDEIVGTWISDWGEKFTFSTEKFSSFYKDEKDKEQLSYEGKNPYIYKIDKKTGYVYIKYTNALNEADVGKWYAIYYSDIATANGKITAKISGAGKEGGKTSTDTLEEAVAEFTVDNGYYAWYSTCTRQ